MTATSPRALVCLLPGLGDALIASPVVRAAAAGGYRIDALTMLSPVSEYARSLGIFHAIHHVPLLADRRAVLSLAALRKERYDLVLVPAPAPRWQYAAAALAAGGRTTVMHRYGGLSSVIAAAGGFFQVALRGGHRIAENLRLAEAVNLSCTDLSYLVPASWKSFEKNAKLLGLHTGSMSYKGNERKRWALEQFAEISRRHQQRGGSVRAFFGPNEAEDEERLRSLVAGIDTVARPLADAARAMSECGVVLANDSGLAHLAAGLGVKTLVLFGMTDPQRCAPIGSAVVLRPSVCPPCFDEGMRRFECVRNIGYRCINEDMSVEYVDGAVEAAFAAPAFKGAEVVREGPLVLYGKPTA